MHDMMPRAKQASSQLTRYHGGGIESNETKSTPTFHQVARAAEPPSGADEAAPASAATPSAGHTNTDRTVIGTTTTMRTDDHTAGTPTDPAPNSSKRQADSPPPGALHYQGDTTEDENCSIGDGQPPTKKRPRRTKKVPKRIRRVTASPSPEAPPESATAGVTGASATATKKRKEQTKKVKRAIDLVSSSSSSSSDDESSEDEKKVSTTAENNQGVGTGADATAKMDDSDEDSYSNGNAGDNDDSDAEMEIAIAESLRTHRQQQRKRSQSSRSGGGSGSGGDGGWLKSFHTSIGGPGSDSDDDGSSSSSDDDDDLDHRLAAISRRNWLSSASRDAKLDHMAKISSDADKILQMLLWDVGFDYHIYSHQFEAIRIVAGLESTFPLARMRKDSGEQEESDSDGSSIDDEDELVRGMLRLDSVGCSARSNALRSAPLLPTRGMLLADEMGLGKTIESLAGAALRNVMQQGATIATAAGGRRNNSLAITPNKKSSRQLPVLIVVPQDGILGQWEETLRKAGVEPARIKILGERKKDAKKRSPNKRMIRGGIFILCTRYKVQSEMRRLFDCSSTADLQANQKKSELFPNVSTALIKKLRNQYLAEKGKERNKCIRKKEARTDCVTRLIRESFRGGDGSSLKAAFHTVIVDEAHFVKNLLAYWGMGVALLGAQSKRTILCTGTPYNNGPQDMSALMAFLDPRHEASRVKWWEDATSKGDKARVVEAVSAWRKTFMIRRTKNILQNKLPTRIRETIDVGGFPCELGIYEAFENKFLSALNQLQEELEDGSPEARRRAKELFDIMMACMSCMRMSLLHPMLPGGREVTIQFSPSRRHLLKREERPKQCVFCCDKYPSEAAKIFAEIQAGRNRDEEEGGGNQHSTLGIGMRMLGLNAHVRCDMDLDDDLLDDEDALDEEGNATVDKKKGPLVQLSADICQASGSDCCHFGHEKCLQLFLEGDDESKNQKDGAVVGNAKKESAGTQKEKLLECLKKCPRCCDLSSRLRIIDPTGKPPHAIYCDEVSTTVDSTMKGFIASAKIEEAVKWFQKKVPKNEKAIILSFFKGSLDLMEGILADELGLECVRYDGDVDKEVRARDLERFKKNETCRVLLATVQSGGTGLNITEANNVLFLDRWFNPCVHDQAESRCHRIGQTKPVKIAYLDNVLTVDVVMKRVNELKEGNAGVLLADGTSLGDTQWNLGYQNLSGVVGTTLKGVMDLRRSIIDMNIAAGNGNAPLPTGDGANLEAQLEERMAARASSKKAPRQIKTERKVKAEAGEEKKDDNDELDIKVRHNLKRSSFLRSIASSSSSSDSDDDLLGGSPIFRAKSEPKTTMQKYSLSGSASSSDDDDLLNGSPTFRKRSSENKDTSNNAPQAKSAGITESTSSANMEKSAVKVEPGGFPPSIGDAPGRKKRGTEDVVVELLSSDSEEEGTNNSETRNLKSKYTEMIDQKSDQLIGNGIGVTTGDQNAEMMEEDDDPEYQQALYESMNDASSKKIDGDDIDDANTDNVEAEIKMTSKELMQAMNDAMKNGDKSRAQELLKRWEASLS